MPARPRGRFRPPEVPGGFGSVSRSMPLGFSFGRPGPPLSLAISSRSAAVPAAIAGAGDTAVRRFLEFFAATIRNKNTRMAYYRAVTDFFAWLDAAGIVALVDIEPLHVDIPRLIEDPVEIPCVFRIGRFCLVHDLSLIHI